MTTSTPNLIQPPFILSTAYFSHIWTDSIYSEKFPNTTRAALTPSKLCGHSMPSSDPWKAGIMWASSLLIKTSTLKSGLYHRHCQCSLWFCGRNSFIPPCCLKKLHTISACQFSSATIEACQSSSSETTANKETAAAQDEYGEHVLSVGRKRYEKACSSESSTSAHRWM